MISSPAFVLLGLFSNTRSQLPVTCDCRSPVGEYGAVLTVPRVDRPGVRAVGARCLRGEGDRGRLGRRGGETRHDDRATGDRARRARDRVHRDELRTALGGVSVNLLSVRLSGVIEKDRLQRLSGSKPDIRIEIRDDGSGTGGCGPRHRDESHDRSHDEERHSFEPSNLQQIHPLVVAEYFREARRTPDQNAHHPPFGLWRQR